MQVIYENIQVFIIGAVLYSGAEILFRGFTHWTMFLAGGICFLLIYQVFTRKPQVSIWKKCLYGALIITVIEFIVGCLINLLLKWDVWDYSHYRFNILGQVCLLFTIIWYVLSFPMVWLVNKLKAITKSRLTI
jgi:uncharacterized membrane protein